MSDLVTEAATFIISSIVVVILILHGLRYLRDESNGSRRGREMVFVSLLISAVTVLGGNVFVILMLFHPHVLSSILSSMPFPEQLRYVKHSVTPLLTNRITAPRPFWLFQAVIPLLSIIVILYFWGGACFLFFIFSRPETESSMRSFLEFHRSFFVGRARHNESPAVIVTREVMREAGLRVWTFTSMPLFGVILGPTYAIALASIGVLFFGGLFLAYSWYGIRCLRVLGLESY